VPIVLDASIAACWYFEDEHDVRADVALNMLNDGDQALAPAHWWFEIRNVIVLGERRRRASEQHTVAFLDYLRELPIELAALPHELAVFTLARRHRLTFYDAAYLELALRAGVPLATLDDALAAAASAAGVPLVTSAR
jgi:predicted nucleic acid-binding protein